MQASGSEKSAIGKGVVIEGEISGAEDLIFAGTMRGNISLPQHRFTLERSGHADANILAKEVVIAGTLTGDIAGAASVQVRGTGAVQGAVRCERISVEEGAVVQGKVEMGDASVKGPGKEQIALEMSVS